MLIYRPTIISGSGYYSGSFDGDGSRLYNIPSSSYAITASYALNGGTGGGEKGDKGEMGDSVFTSSLQGVLVTVNHNLDLEYPVYNIYDNLGKEVIPKEFTIINPNSVQVNFGIPFTGSISISAGQQGFKGQKGGKGEVGVKGNKGELGEAVYSSSIQGSLISISHNLDIQYPVFTIYDNLGDNIIPKSFSVINDNTVEVDFGIGFTGSISIASGIKGQKGEPYNGSVIYESGSKIGIGIPNPTFQLQLSTNSAGKPTGGSWSDSSDIRLKTDIKDIDNPLHILKKIRGVTFRWKDGLRDDFNSGGFIADELENVFPSWVTIQESSEKEKLYIEDNKVKTISLPFYFDAIIVESIKKQQEEIEMLKTSILELELLIKNK
jgi:hypothetical protein